MVLEVQHSKFWLTSYAGLIYIDYDFDFDWWNKIFTGKNSLLNNYNQTRLIAYTNLDETESITLSLYLNLSIYLSYQATIQPATSFSQHQ